MITPEAV